LRRAVLVLGLLAAAGPARAELALLANGQVFKVASHRAEGASVWLSLKGGGEISLPAAEVRGFVPDEVMDEVGPARDLSELEKMAEDTARRHGLEPSLVRAVAAVESGFRPAAVSPKGAQGLMQLMPSTARSLGVEDAFDPASNLDGGTRHLRTLLERYEGDLAKALAAYNAGEGAVARHGGVPPYRETKAYVKKVLQKYESDQR
jgi:hypothetical protein